MKSDERVLTAHCPDCKEEISLGTSPLNGDRLICQNCWAALIIISLEPLELKWDIEEVDDDDDDDDDDEGSEE